MATFTVIEAYDFDLPVKRPLYHPGDRHVYIDFCNNEPFYVGMGTRERVNDVKRNDTHTQLWGNLGPNDVLVRRIVARGYSRIDAELLETRLILKYGRRDVETGPLVNKNNGVGNESQYEAREQVQRQRRAEEQKRRAEQEAREAAEAEVRRQAEAERAEKAKRVEVLFNKFKDDWASIPPTLRTTWLNQISGNAPAWKEILFDLEKRLNSHYLEQQRKAQAEAARQARERDEAEVARQAEQRRREMEAEQARREVERQRREIEEQLARRQEEQVQWEKDCAAARKRIIEGQREDYASKMSIGVFVSSLFLLYLYVGAVYGVRGIWDMLFPMGLIIMPPILHFMLSVGIGWALAAMTFIASEPTQQEIERQVQSDKEFEANHHVNGMLPQTAPRRPRPRRRRNRIYA